jgi:hypothetical protein
VTKQFRLRSEEIKPVAVGYGACIASDMITVDGYPVRFMYRQSPDNEVDSGWRFFSGYEDDAYTSNADNHGIYDVNTIANYDPSITPLLESQEGCVFEKALDAQSFSPVLDWFPEEQ